MAKYIQVTVATNDKEQNEIVIALLAAEGYEGFEEQSKAVVAFIEESLFDENILNELRDQHGFTYTTETIDEQNWNAVWESGFEPVVVDDFVAIRASFHQPVEGVKHEIVITPKMSFGTGHHATTYMMIQQMGALDFKDKTVFDFGTGTGVLAVLAEKLGAKRILGIDNDDWSIENALENIVSNQCSHITIAKAQDADTKEKFDIILANINKHIIINNLPLLTSNLHEFGYLLLSGLLEGDEKDILIATELYSVRHVTTIYRDKWICMLFQSA